MSQKILTTFVIFSFISLSAEARRDGRRENRQEARIAQGVKSGELTRAEAHRLHRGQKRVDNAQESAKADGVVTNEEAARLEKMQDVQSKRIFEQKHDEQKRRSANEQH